MSFKDILKNSQTLAFLKNTKTLIFLTLLLVPLLYTYSIPALYFGFFKFLCLLILGLYAATQIQKKDIPVIMLLFIISAAGESLLAIFQFINQGSLNGFFYFLGERYYSASSIGIAVMNSDQGSLVRPYGTFPHPNVLAYFLFITSVLLCSVLVGTKKRIYKHVLYVSFFIIQVGLFLTFSRILILLNAFLFIAALLFKLRTRKKNMLGFGILASVGLATYAEVFNLRFLNFSNILPDILSRLEALPITLSSITSYPLGLGLSNFFYYQGDIQVSFSSVYLQPIHNIFLLLLVEIGLPCTLLFVYFLGLTLVKLGKIVKTTKTFSFSLTLFIILITSIITGMFDHYLLTIWQGQLLFAIILGLSWNKNV